MNWKPFYILFAMTVMLLVEVGYANVRLPRTLGEFRQWPRMEDMQWCSTLSEEQVNDVRSALSSEFGALAEAALNNVVVHHLDDLLPVIENKVDTPDSAAARPFHKICADVLKAEGDPVPKLREVLATELPGDAFIRLPGKPSDFRPVRYMVTSLIVCEEVRAVRAGRKQKPDVSGLELSEFERELVRLNELDVDAGIRAALDQLSDVRVIGPREMAFIQVLHTYPPDKCFPLVLDKLERAPASDGYGRMVLLGLFRFRCDQLDQTGKERLRSIIRSMKEAKPTAPEKAIVSALESEL